MASHPDSPPAGPDDNPDGFEPGLGGAGTDARPEGESAYRAGVETDVEGTGPAADETSPPDSPGDYGGTAGTGGVDKAQEDLDR